MTSQLFSFCAGKCIDIRYIDKWLNSLVMSPSWNFPAQAEPSYEGSKPSQAELGHFNFRAETELDFF